MADRLIRRQDLWPLGATGFILAVTASWWALALWSVPGAPEWLERTRSVCFNITESGLPDAKGWLLLLGQPPTMLAMLMVGWRDDVRATFAHLVAFGRGRALLGSTLAFTLLGFVLAGVHVAGAGVPAVALPSGLGGASPRVDRPWPESAGLVNQEGTSFSHAALGGRAAWVTFAFGHCETVCPVVVHEARSARMDLEADVSIVVLTLDPWRDTPGRLKPIHAQFQLDPELDHVVGGSPEAVEAALDSWGIPRQRDPRTGDIVHPALVYLVEPDGTLAFASSGARADLLVLADRLGWRDTAP